MSVKTCDQIRDRLVDYADGDLPADQAKEVTDHLAQCPPCRQFLQGLHRSLQVARDVWDEAFRHAADIQPASLRRSRMPLWPRVAVAAAAIAMVAGGVFLAIKRPGLSPSPMAAGQIARTAERTASAARLLAATELLAQCQDTQALVEAQYRYILTEYADTPVAANLRKRGL